MLKNTSGEKKAATALKNTIRNLPCTFPDLSIHPVWPVGHPCALGPFGTRHWVVSVPK